MRTQKPGFCINLDRQVSVNHNPLNPKFLKETCFPGIHPVTENTEGSSPVLKDVIINKSRHRALGDSKRTWRDGKTTWVAHPREVSRNPRSFKARKYVNVTIACLVYLQGGVHPAVAHNIQTDGTVGATFHIEPDHTPHAGEPATAWFALTTSGGEPLPLSQCDCRLAVYDRAVNPSVPILTPPLKAIAAEQYRDIPGAEVIFPQAGIYELEISGSPKSDADFEAFSLPQRCLLCRFRPHPPPQPLMIRSENGTGWRSVWVGSSRHSPSGFCVTKHLNRSGFGTDPTS
jgi:hypothetical protein